LFYHLNPLAYESRIDGVAVGPNAKYTTKTKSAINPVAMEYPK
jgi:hypothetical protein